MSQREIKFRSWDKAEKKMIVPGVGDEMFFFTNSGELLRDTPDVFDFTPEKNWIPMQFTGLEDKNGKEIYEGDILGFGDSSGVAGVVEFGTKELFCGFSEDGEYNIYKTYTCFYVKDEPLEGAGDDFIVLGNIYENSELLK